MSKIYSDSLGSVVRDLKRSETSSEVSKMIGAIIVRPHARIRHFAAPFLKEREEYISYLLRQGHTQRGVRAKASLLLQVIRLMEISSPRMVDLVEISRAAKSWAEDQEFHKIRKAGKKTEYRLYALALDLFRFHGLLNEPATPEQSFRTLLEDFARHLRETRGLASATIRGYMDRVSKFMNWIVIRHDCFADVTLIDIDDYLDSRREAGLRPATIASLCQALRTFFKYLECQGGCSQGLAHGIQSPTIPKYNEVPQGPPWKDVRKLLQFAVPMSPGDIRAKAVLSLCAIYGLRSCEVAGLRLSDFDWYGETLTIRRAKRGRVRPRCSCRSLFVTRYAPYRPVLPTTLRPVVTRRMNALKIRSEHMGPHALRHACATELLRKGSTLKDISGFLGHRDMKSVCIYAKYDASSLREVSDFSLAGVR
jgi:integrase/recombinase XerD